MLGRIVIGLVGFAAGYVVGTRQGRRGYDKIKAQAAEAWRNPAVQRGVDAAQELARDRIPIVGDAVASAIDRVTLKAGDAAQSADPSGAQDSANPGDRTD